MATIPKKALDRIVKETGKFQRILTQAKSRDINEADTVVIVSDVLADLLGFDKYSEITRELAIRGTFCDLAVKSDGKIKYLIEVKAVGLELKENHLRQVVEYGASEGVQWVILTNGIEWEIHRILFERPINTELVCKFNFLELNPRKGEDQERLFVICKEGLSKAAIEEFHHYQQVVNRFVISAIILGDPVIDVIRKELRRISPGLKVDSSTIESIVNNEILKRDVIEGDSGKQAISRYNRLINKIKKQKETAKNDAEPTSSEHAETTTNGGQQASAHG